MEMNNYNGYCGRFLRVDMTSGGLKEERLKDLFDEPTQKKLLGGANFGLKIIYDELPPGIDPYDPENRLVFATGPITGTGAICSGPYSVVTKGPLTNLAAVSTSNGFFGARLKFAGYDGIILQGAAQDWQYLVLHDGVAELKDASHLVGKDTWETERAIWEEFGDKASVACIGVSGENLVRGAAIMNDSGHFCSTNGVGAVMGSKKIKAIVAYGKKVSLAKDKAEFKETSKSWRTLAKTLPKYKRLDQNGTAAAVQGLYKTSALPIRNLTSHVLEPFKYNVEYLRESDDFERKVKPCFACPIKHIYWMKYKDGPNKGKVIEEPEYEDYAGWGANIGVVDPLDATRITDINDRLGMDLKEYTFTISMAMECFEKGILTKKDTDGLDLTWGNTEVVITLLHKIAKREGFGNILAEGAMRAAEIIGGDAPKYAAYYKKGIAPHVHDPRADWTMLLSTAVSDFGSFVSLNTKTRDADETVKTVVEKGADRQMFDCLVICRFGSEDAETYDDITATLNAATGFEYTKQELLDCGERTIHLARAFSIKHGATPDLDCMSEKLAEVPVDGVYKGVSIAPVFKQMVKDYYHGMGWDEKTSKPLPATLRRIGLEELIDDLW
jgi:aldehyde:ferredoxin oxidoreductase